MIHNKMWNHLSKRSRSASFNLKTVQRACVHFKHRTIWTNNNNFRHSVSFIHSSALVSSPKTSKKELAQLKQAAKMNSRNQGGGIEGDIVARLENVGKLLPGGRQLFKNANLAFLRGAKIGVVGLNGSGKSSLFRILARQDKDHDGQVWFEDGMRIGYLEQEPDLNMNKTVHENIMDGLKEKTYLLDRFEEIAAAMAEPDADFDALLEEQADIQQKIDTLDCWTLHHRVEAAKAALRVPPDNADVRTLSGGEKRRIALCRLLLEEPEFLLLDEPTNHLDTQSVKWLEEFLHKYKGTVIAVTHDRYFLDNVAGWILEVDRGSLYPYAGNYSMWLHKRAERLDIEDKMDKRRRAAMEDELKWIRQGRNGQQAKSKSRIEAFEKMQEDVSLQNENKKFLSGAILIPPGPRLGYQVLEAQNVSYRLPNEKETSDTEGRVLFKNVSFEIPRGAMVGVVGGNGTGKTTLMRILAGELSPSQGAIKVGDTVKLAFASQMRDNLEENARVMDAISDGTGIVHVGDNAIDARAYLAGFNLKGDAALKYVKSLSGGERNRVHLARILSQSANFLILDEPTNDLDVDTLRSLENALETFHGSALIVSHDRYFLDRITTHTLAFREDGSIDFFFGNWSEYEQTRGAISTV